MSRIQIARREVLVHLGLALGAPTIAMAKSPPIAEERGIEGHWACRSETRLERPKALHSLWVTRAEADAYMKSRQAPPPPGADPVGQSTTEWTERGPLTDVGGRFMSSWIIDPPDGKLPYSDNGRVLLKALEKQFDDNMDNPEVRDAAERCLGGTVGPPLIDVGYGGHLLIVCTATHVAIRTEEGFAPRIVKLGASTEPQTPRSWTGVTRAHFEGVDLIVETTNFHPAFLLRNDGFYLSSDAKVSERFTRSAKDELRYTFTIDDPAIYTQTWRAMMVFKTSDAPTFDFACHEGNYALANILSGGREKDKAGATPARVAASPP
jgi:hypothetical protein